jgi:hypothetical protein
MWGLLSLAFFNNFLNFLGERLLKLILHLYVLIFLYKVSFSQSFNFICMVILSLSCFLFKGLNQIFKVIILLDKCVLKLLVVSSVTFHYLSVFLNVILQILTGNLW